MDEKMGQELVNKRSLHISTWLVFLFLVVCLVIANAWPGVGVVDEQGVKGGTMFRAYGWPVYFLLRPGTFDVDYGMGTYFRPNGVDATYWLARPFDVCRFGFCILCNAGILFIVSFVVEVLVRGYDKSRITIRVSPKR